MSYIHNALKKAQKEKDSRYTAYGNCIATESGLYNTDINTGGKIRRTKVVLVSAFILVSGIAAGLTVMNFSKPPQHVIPKAPQRTALPPVPSKPVEAVTVKEPVPVSRSTNVPVKKPVQKEREEKKQRVDAAALFQKALMLQKQGRLDDAEDMYRLVLKASPTHARALNNLGVIYLRYGDEDQAVRLFSEATKTKDGSADPYYNLACVFAKRGDALRSLQYLRQAISVNANVRAWARKDGDLESLGQLEEFRKLVGLEAGNTGEGKSGSAKGQIVSPAVDKSKSVEKQ